MKIPTKGHIKPHFYQGLHRLQRQNTISKYMQGNYYITSRGLSRSSSEIPFWNNLVVESFFLFSFSNTRKMPLLQKVKSQMKGCQMRHFIRVGTACANVKSPRNCLKLTCKGEYASGQKGLISFLLSPLYRSLPVVHNSKKKLQY